MNFNNFLVVLFVLVFFKASCDSFELQKEWVSHKEKYNLQFTIDEEAVRFKVFADNVNKINEHNSDPNQLYKKGINKFTHLTHEEFQLTLAKFPENKPKLRMASFEDDEELPDNYDCRTEGLVSTVKDQEGCGSCFAFCSAAALEGMYRKLHPKEEIPDFSPQQIVDCDKYDGGCEGGWPQNVYTYVFFNGIETWENYPYAGKEQECAFDSAKVVMKNAGYRDVPQNRDSLKRALMKNGPCSVAVDASDWYSYKGGIFTGCNKNINYNHGVLLVGWGVENDQKFWTIKNSWGPSYGEDGYIRILQNDDPKSEDNCGVQAYGSFPIPR
ncbi:cysteine protease rdl2-related [Anaeramoeba flamelloides]|uniref:Cysteine protease rdl2-related n=1 Tax=Anaeramoeba flamelloides TaxID=1746091 RepID=A0ABQ8XM95_9EUKA|nr:cysteine protease rdl2-related [Anaeramoeba flamelloides]